MTKQHHVVYMATNMRNGKRYVGMSSRGLSHRSVRHINLAISGSSSCSRFYDAIRKYGSDSFEWIILCECLSRKSGRKTVGGRRFSYLGGES